MNNLDFVVMTTAFGGRDIAPLQKAIPNLKVCVDYNHDAMGNFLNSMRMTEKPSVHIEDDIILCNGFWEKIHDAVSRFPDHVINFFSLRSRDYVERKPFFVAGSKFMMNQCFYLPAGYGFLIADFYNRWARKSEHPTGYDILIADFLKSRKERYVQWFPHLVNHKIGKSMINPKRSSMRIDKNFKKDL